MVLNDKSDLTADEIIVRLKDEGIGARPFFYSLNNQPVFRKLGLFNNEKYPVSEYLSEKGFYIPSGLGISDKEIILCSEKLLKILD